MILYYYICMEFRNQQYCRWQRGHAYFHLKPKLFSSKPRNQLFSAFKLCALYYSESQLRNNSLKKCMYIVLLHGITYCSCTVAWDHETQSNLTVANIHNLDIMSFKVYIFCTAETEVFPLLN